MIVFDPCKHEEQIDSIERELRLFPYDYTDEQAEALQVKANELRNQCEMDCR